MDGPLTHRQVIYMILGIGADDVFILYDAWLQSAHVEGIKDRSWSFFIRRCVHSKVYKALIIRKATCLQLWRHMLKSIFFFFFLSSDMFWPFFFTFSEWLAPSAGDLVQSLRVGLSSIGHGHAAWLSMFFFFAVLKKKHVKLRCLVGHSFGDEVVFVSRQHFIRISIFFRAQSFEEFAL